MNIEYVITGDTAKFKDCLIYVVGSSFENAERALDRMINNPNENDKKIIKEYTNIHIATVNKNDCWWNENCD